MSQSQFAGGIGDPPQTFPSRGQLIRDFTLPSSLGLPITLSDYREGANLVLVLLEGCEGANLEILTGFATGYDQLQEEQAKVLAVLHCERDRAAHVVCQMNLPFPVLVDEDGQLSRTADAEYNSSQPAITVYITDVFGEVFAVYRTAEGQAIPGIPEIAKWLNLINRQCPECGHPEW